MMRWHLDGPDLREAARRLGVPALAIVGDDERIVDVGNLRAAFGERLRIVPGSAHTIPVEQPAALAALIGEAARSFAV